MKWYKYPESKPMIDRKRCLVLFENGHMELLRYLTIYDQWVDDDYSSYMNIVYWTIIEDIPVPDKG